MVKASTLYQLGLDYYHGRDLPQDTDMAIDYLLKASYQKHLEAKIFCAGLLFEQAKNQKSVYYNQAYQLGTELLVEVYRLGQIEVTFPYLLGNPLISHLLTQKEMKDYYQKAYLLGHQDIKFELAKLLYLNQAYQDAEPLFLESIKEGISQESHSYLYYIYHSDIFLDQKKALFHLKEALKYGFIPDDYQALMDTNPYVLIHPEIYDCQFSIKHIKNQVLSVIKNCYYADLEFKEWISEEKISIRVYMDLNFRLLNASYDLLASDLGKAGFSYEPVELGETYFIEAEKAQVDRQNEVSSKKDFGFYQSQERESYLSVDIKDLLNRFEINEETPILNTSNQDAMLDQTIQVEIKKDIINKHKEATKNPLVRVKKFNVYKIVIPSFEFAFNYQDQVYKSKRYAFNDQNWQSIFKNEMEQTNDPGIMLSFDFPLSDAFYQTVERMRQSVPLEKKKAILIHLFKSLCSMFLLWSSVILINHLFLGQSYTIDSYNLWLDLSNNWLLYTIFSILFGFSYYITRLKIDGPNLDHIKDQITINPAYVLPENTNKTQIKMQILEIVLQLFFLIMFLLFSQFFNPF